MGKTNCRCGQAVRVNGHVPSTAVNRFAHVITGICGRMGVFEEAYGQQRHLVTHLAQEIRGSQPHPRRTAGVTEEIEQRRNRLFGISFYFEYEISVRGNDADRVTHAQQSQLVEFGRQQMLDGVETLRPVGAQIRIVPYVQFAIARAAHVDVDRVGAEPEHLMHGVEGRHATSMQLVCNHVDIPEWGSGVLHADVPAEQCEWMRWRRDESRSANGSCGFQYRPTRDRVTFYFFT